MGIFNSISKLVFGDPTKGIAEATAQNVAGQTKAADYLKKIDAPLLGYRDEALSGLSDYYLGGQEGQQSFYDTARASPAYENLVGVGEEAAMRAASATGNFRGGALKPALAANSQNVLQGLVNQNLQGMQSFSNPNLNTSSIANLYSGIGQTQGQGTTAINQAGQDQVGQLMGLIAGGASAAGGLGWSPFG